MLLTIEQTQKQLNAYNELLAPKLEPLGFVNVAPDQLGWLLVYSKTHVTHDWVIRISIDSDNKSINVDINYLWKGGWLLSPNQKEKTTSALLFSGQYPDGGFLVEEFPSALRAVLDRKNL